MLILIRHFYVILSVQYISGDLLMLQDHFQGQKVSLKINFAQIRIGTSVIPFCCCDFDWRIRLF